MRPMWRDLRFAVRSLVASPGLTLVATLTLAVATAATAAVLSLLNGVVLKPLPVERPRELVLFSDDPSDGVYTGTQRGTWILFSTPSFEHLRAHQRSFQDVCAFQAGRERLAARVDSAAAELAYVTRVSGNYFGVLGVGAQAGRTIAPADDRPGVPPVAVLSDAYWSRRFARDPAVIGHAVTLGDRAYTIIGVAPRKFYGETMRAAPDVWAPIATRTVRAGAAYDDHHTYWLDLIGRLKPGVTIAQASADVNRALTEFLSEEAGSELTAERRAEIAHTSLALARGDLGRSAVRARAATPLTLLFILVALLLVTASVNVASLLLARAAARERITAVHLMLGASRGQLLRATTIETMCLVAPGCAIGVGAALFSPRLLLPLLTTAPLPVDLAPDARLVGMLVGSLAAAALLACGGPVWFVLTADGLPWGRHMGRSLQGIVRMPWGRPLQGVGGGSSRAGRALVAAQLALAVPLLIVAGLLLRSVDRLEGQDLAVDRHHVLIMDFGPVGAVREAPLRDANADRAALARADVLAAVRAQPHVAAATFASQTPLGGDIHGSSLRVAGRPPREDGGAEGAFVGPGYLRAMGMPLVAGRDFTEDDDAAHPRVIILNETAARTFLPGENALGQRIAYGSRPPAEIVGIARDVKFASLRAAAPRQAFLPQMQYGGYTGRLVVRTDGDPLQTASAIRAAAQRAAPNLPVVKMGTLDAEIRAATATERALAATAAALAAATLLVSGTGLCSLMAYIVARRTREFGVRMALGASASRIMLSVLAAALRVSAIGAALGLTAAIATRRLVASLLYDVKPADPVIAGGACVLMLAAAIGASLWPARRASRVDPIVALRAE